DSGSGGEKRKWRHDHFVTRADFKSLQSQEQGGRAGRTADRIASAAIARDFIFEGGDFRPEDNLAARKHPADGLFDLGLQFLVLRLKIAKRNPCSVRPAHALTPFRWPPIPWAFSGIDEARKYDRKVRLSREVKMGTIQG